MAFIPKLPDMVRCPLAWILSLPLEESSEPNQSLFLSALIAKRFLNRLFHNLRVVVEA